MNRTIGRSRRWLSRLAGRFGRDQRGGTAVQAMAFLPIILFAFVVASIAWQTVMIRRSLHTGTYLAMRYLSLYPPASTDPYHWSLTAQEFVHAELKNNPFVGDAVLNEVSAPVDVTLFDSNDCGDQFEVRAGYRLFAPLGQMDNQPLPSLRPYVLEDIRMGEVLCDK